MKEQHYQRCYRTENSARLWRTQWAVTGRTCYDHGSPNLIKWFLFTLCVCTRVLVCMYVCLCMCVCMFIHVVPRVCNYVRFYFSPLKFLLILFFWLCEFHVNFSLLTLLAIFCSSFHLQKVISYIDGSSQCCEHC